MRQVNQDAEGAYPSVDVTCHIVQIVMRHRGLPPVDLKCGYAHPPSFSCENKFGEHVCTPVNSGGVSLGLCSRLCPKPEEGEDDSFVVDGGLSSSPPQPPHPGVRGPRAGRAAAGYV